MKTIIRLILLSVVLYTTALLLSACGGGDEGEPAVAVQPTTAAATALPPIAAATQEPAAAPIAPEPVIISGSGDITAVVEQYRQLLGANNGGTPGQYTSGFREINWDGVPDELAAPNFMPPDFFNDTAEPRARGAFFTTPGEGVQVSADSDNPYGTSPYFTHINDSYTFKAFSEERLFSPIGSNIVDLTFFVPGTDIPATVTGFGAVYTDVDTSHTAFEYFDKAGNSLGTFETPIADAGLSFLGVIFAEPIVYRVQIRYGTSALGPDDSNDNDVAVMDNFIYGEPQPLAGAASFAGAIPGSQVFVALVRDDQQVLAYVCDGRSISDWFQGEAQNDMLDLVAKSGARLQATFNDGVASGAFSPAGGTSLNFTANVTAAPAGLYRDEVDVDGVPYVAGWIVLPDGEQQGALTLTASETKSPSVSGTANASPPKPLPPKILPAPPLSPEEQQELEELRISLLLDSDKQ